MSSFMRFSICASYFTLSAWRLYDEEEEQWLDHWLITGGTRIVEFVSGSVQMTDVQKATVGEKLLNADAK